MLSPGRLFIVQSVILFYKHTGYDYTIITLLKNGDKGVINVEENYAAMLVPI